jgi:hypothetical protein
MFPFFLLKRIRGEVEGKDQVEGTDQKMELAFLQSIEQKEIIYL